jgi:hypothetical protein
VATRVIAQQLSAQVWPYVTFTGTTEPERLELDVANDGLGPAVVKSFVLRVDGKPQRVPFTSSWDASNPIVAPASEPG